jgi:hypothetical protein
MAQFFLKVLLRNLINVHYGYLNILSNNAMLLLGWSNYYYKNVMVVIMNWLTITKYSYVMVVIMNWLTVTKYSYVMVVIMNWLTVTKYSYVMVVIMNWLTITKYSYVMVVIMNWLTITKYSFLRWQWIFSLSPRFFFFPLSLTRLLWSRREKCCYFF